VANEYLTLQEFKDLRRIEDTLTDGILQTRLTRASRAIDDATGRRFYLEPVASAREFQGIGGGVSVDDIGTLADLELSIDGAAITDYAVHPRNALAKKWPIDWLTHVRFSGAVTVAVTARWGWPEVPEPIKEATFLLANRRLFRRDSPEGVAGVSNDGPVRITSSDPDIRALLELYVLDGFGW
jgi:hypothetical protein